MLARKNIPVTVAAKQHPEYTDIKPPLEKKKKNNHHLIILVDDMGHRFGKYVAINGFSLLHSI